MAVYLSHKVGDGSSLLNFINHWATVARSRSGERHDLSDIDTHFISYQTRIINLPKILPDIPPHDYEARSFVFHNSEINDLKAKITSMTIGSEEPITNPTRVEALTWLLHKYAVALASKKELGHSQANRRVLLMCFKDKFVEPLLEITVGNFYHVLEVPTMNESELTTNNIISELRKRRRNFKVKKLETALGVVAEMCFDHTVMIETTRRIHEEYYVYFAMHRFPTFGIDFGWGKPIKVPLVGALKNLIVMMNTPNRDGIEALVSLEKQDMKIFENEPELLAFC